MQIDDMLIGYGDCVLVTGANGFIGSRVVRTLLDNGFTHIRCLVRSESGAKKLISDLSDAERERLSIIEGNLLSREVCDRATRGVSVIYHLAAGIEKTFSGCYMNSVVTTKNLIESAMSTGKNLKRFVNVSSIAVYTNRDAGYRRMLDEASEVDQESHLRYEAYTYGKEKQDELLMDYARRYSIPYVIVRPGEVFGPGKRKISGRVGIDTFGFFLHLGGRGQVPLTYIDNCADAIVLAGIVPRIEGNVFNIVDDNLPTSRKFLRLYKRNVEAFKSIYLPYWLTFSLCYMWERYSSKSNGQLPPIFNRKQCTASWKRIRYSNKKIHEMLRWQPRVPMDVALQRYFEYMKKSQELA